jgi:arylsulfatase A-like enzyme
MPLFMTGPGVRSGLVSTAPVQLEDIAPTVLSAMGVTPTGMSGNELTDALIQSTPAAQKAREAEKTQMEPVVKALSSQG